MTARTARATFAVIYSRQPWGLLTIPSGMFIRTPDREAANPGCILSCEPPKASGAGSEVGVRGLECYSTLRMASFGGA
jgi:hypothetical protein